MAKILESLSFNLKRLRQERGGVTQKEVADLCGVDLQVIKNAEGMYHLTSTQNLEKIAKGLKVEETELFRDPALKPSVQEAFEAIGIALGLNPAKVLAQKAKEKIPDDILSWSSSEAHPEDWENIREYIKIGKEHRQRIAAGEQNNHAPANLTVTSTFEERVLDRLRKLDQIDQKDLEDWLDRLLAKRKEKKKAKDAG